MSGSEFSLDAMELRALVGAMHRFSVFKVKDLLHGIGVAEEGEVKERFEKKEDPDGKTWKDWSNQYKAQRNSAASLLMDSGRLQESVGFEVNSTGVLWGSTLIYSRIHQKGGYAGRGRKVKIPARPYLGIGRDGRELLSETIADFLRSESGGLL